MSYQYTPLSGGIEYVQVDEPEPDENASWAEILVSEGEPVSWQLQVSDGQEWYEV